MEIILNTKPLPKNIFKNKNFILLFLGKLVSQFGDVIYNIAIGWYILTVTHSAAQMSIYMAVGTIVYIIMGPFGGIIADRFDRKKIIIWMDIIRGAAVAVTGILMYLNVVSIYIFCGISVVLSVCGALFVPASNAMIPMIVEDENLTKANSLGATVGSTCGIVGTIMGGVLYGLLGIKMIFILNAVSYIVCGFLEVFIELPKKEKNNFKDNNTVTKKHLFRELRESYNFMRSEKGLFKLMWFSTLINFLITPIMAIFVPYIFNQILKVSPEQYSYVGAASSIGMLVGAGILTILPQKERISQYVKVSLITFSLLFFAIYSVMLGNLNSSLSSVFVVILFVIIFFMIGIASSLLNIPTSVVIQRMVPNEILGKVSSLINTLIMAAMPLGIIIGGAVADIVPMYILIFVISVIFAIITFYLCVQKDIKKI